MGQRYIGLQIGRNRDAMQASRLMGPDMPHAMLSFPSSDPWLDEHNRSKSSSTPIFFELLYSKLRKNER